MSEPFTISAGKFFASWLPVLAVSASVDPAPRLADLFALPIGGVTVPLLTCALGLLGVLLARPLARRKEAAEQGLAKSWIGFSLVTLIMLIVVELWIIESRPGALFAFVIAIGLGFSGYSLIELIGDQVRDFIKRIVGVSADRIAVDPQSTTTEPQEDPK